MGKYAPNPKCGACIAVGELCMQCALDWRLKQSADETRVLRRIAAIVRDRALLRIPELKPLYKRLDTIRNRKPRRKKR